MGKRIVMRIARVIANMICIEKHNVILFLHRRLHSKGLRDNCSGNILN